MADATDPTAKPAQKPRKAAPGKATESVAGDNVTTTETAPAEGTAAPTFTESAQQAKAALVTAGAAARAKLKAATGAAREKAAATDWKAEGEHIKVKATHAAKEAADATRAKTGAAMEALSRLVNETAKTVDAKLGPNYGDYARQAAETVAGAVKSIDVKDIDKLLGEARDFVRKSPAVSIGAAAVAGFVLMRLAKGGDAAEDAPSDDA